MWGWRSTDNKRPSNEVTREPAGVFACGLFFRWHGLEFQVTGHRVTELRVRGVQRSEPRCTLMLGERCVWFSAGLKYPSPSSCRLHE